MDSSKHPKAAAKASAWTNPLPRNWGLEESHPALRYGLAVVVTALAFIIDRGMSPAHSPIMVLFVVPILLSAFFGGVGPGSLATVLVAFITGWFSIKSVASEGGNAGFLVLRWVILVGIGVSVTFMGAAVKSALVRVKELERQESNARFRNTFEHAPTGITHADSEGRWLEVNPKFSEMLGYSEEELIGHALREFTHPEDIERDQEGYRRLISGEFQYYRIEKRYRRKDGSYFWAELTRSVVHERDGVHTINIVVDITPRKEAENALRESEAKLNGVIGSAMDAIIGVNSQQVIVLFNQAAERMFRCPASEALGSSLDRFIPARYRGRHRHDVEKFGRTGVTTRKMGGSDALSGLRADGEEFPIEASISHVRYGNETLYTVILRDITERTRAEEELKRTRDALERANSDLEKRVEERTVKLRETIADLEHFSYTITHDMRAPLRAMEAFGNILKEEYEDQLDEQGKDFIRRISQAAKRMDALITDALNYTKVLRAEMHLEPVDPGTLLRGMIESYPEFQYPKSEIRIVHPLPAVLANPAGLTQCFSNLLSNAVKFSPRDRRPTVQIRAEVMPVPLDWPSHNGTGARKAKPEHVVRIWFEDNGIGIPEDQFQKIFMMFQRVSKDYEGTGIGLALVKKVVERMRGRVGVESQPGNGSSFWLELAKAPGEKP